MTLWISFQYYNLLDPAVGGFAGFEIYTFLLTVPCPPASATSTVR